MTANKHQQSGKVTIIGGGPIGLTFALMAAAQHIETTLVSRNKRKLPSTISGSVLVSEVPDPESPIIVAVKAYDLESTLKSLQNSLSSSTPIVLVQNGLGIFLDATSILKRRVPYVRALLYFGARLISEEELTVYGPPSSVLAAPDYGKAALDQVAKLFTQIGINVTLHSNVAHAEWEKALVSLSVVAVAALKKETNDLFNRSDEAKRDVLTLLSEARAIAASEGFKTLNPSDDEILSSALRFGENKNSLLLDIEKGKNSELEVTLGRALRIAKANDIKAPTLANYYEKLSIVRKN